MGSGYRGITGIVRPHPYDAPGWGLTYLCGTALVLESDRRGMGQHWSGVFDNLPISLDPSWSFEYVSFPLMVDSVILQSKGVVRSP